MVQLMGAGTAGHFTLLGTIPEGAGPPVLKDASRSTLGEQLGAWLGALLGAWLGAWLGAGLGAGLGALLGAWPHARPPDGDSRYA